MLTFDREERLPVFSYEEEAEMFLRLEGVGEGWRVRETRAGELVSLLCGPCAGVKEVALDPLPGMVAERTVELVSLDRRCFIELIMAERRSLRFGGSGRQSSPHENERDREGEPDPVAALCAAGRPRNPGTGHGARSQRRHHHCQATYS